MPKSYTPSPVVADILDRALSYVNSVPYQVTARWVFYRLLQDGVLETKADYKRLLGYLSSARKGFSSGWHPATLSDDMRAAVVRGTGFDSGSQWVDAYARGIHCNLDRWASQSTYVEVWFEAAAMASQFTHYTNPNVTLLAFHGDISIPEKWKAATRLVSIWQRFQVPIVVLYYGDLDPKGIQIPESARRDVEDFAWQHTWDLVKGNGGDMEVALYEAEEFQRNFQFIRVGLNEQQVIDYGIPDNPERPGTYQWEGVSDEAAQELIGFADQYLDQEAFDSVERREVFIRDQARAHLRNLVVAEYPPDA